MMEAITRFWGIPAFLLLFYPLQAIACEDKVVQRHLVAQTDFLSGDASLISQEVENLRFQNLALENDDISEFGICNKLLFGVLESSVALFKLGGWSVLVDAPVAERFLGLQTFISIQSRYRDLREDISKTSSGYSRDISRLIEGIVRKLSDIALDLIDAQPDRVITSLSSRFSSNEQVYRVLSEISGELLLYEFSLKSGLIFARSYEVGRRSSPIVDADVLNLPRREMPGLVDWAALAKVRLREADSWIFSTRGYSFDISWYRRNLSIGERKDALNELLRLVREYVEPVPYVGPEVEEDSIIGASGYCIKYRTPDDDDLWIYEAPSTFASRRKASPSETRGPFAVIGSFRPSKIGEEALLEPHDGEYVIYWVPVNILDALHFLVYRKKLFDGRSYTRFVKTPC